MSDSETDELEYVDLAPIDNIKKGDIYCKALEWALKNENIKNIALTGSYGSGKSSIIHTYINKHPHLQYLDISLASFCEELTQKNNKSNNADDDANFNNGDTIKFSENRIEEGILKQLFYKVDYKKIPHSRYRKIHNVSFYRIFTWFCICAFLIIVDIFFIIPKKYIEISNIIKVSVAFYHISITLLRVLLIASVIVVSIILSYILWYVITKFKLSKVEIPNKAEIQQKNDEESTVLNKNLEEILYFFEVTKYSVVFIEDLDRFENAKIFIKLRELNMLLNNYDKIKRRIVFIYAVRDDIFTKNDRTKFFDFIIPVVPIINSTNSGEKMLERIQKSKWRGNISDSYISQVSVYIEDMRVLTSIYNEYLVYKNVVSDIDGLKDEQMLTLMIYKNLYPKDFTLLQHEQGLIKNAFLNKNIVINDKSRLIIEERKKLKNEINKTISDTLNSVKELKYVIWENMMMLVPGKIMEIEVFPQGNFTNVIRINITQFLDDNFNLHDLEGKKIRITYQSGYSSQCIDPIFFNDINSKSSTDFTYIERYDYLINSSPEKQKQMKEQITILQEKEHYLGSMRLAELIKEFGAEEVLPLDVLKNKFVVFALRHSYIDENYANYLNYFHPNSITKDDMNFIMAVRNYEAFPYNYELHKISNIIDRLVVYEFEQKEIYNFSILDSLLTKCPESKKTDAFMTQLADENKKSLEFIDEYINVTKNREEFVSNLCTKWNGIWSWIEKNNSLTDERKLFYFENIMHYSSVEDIIKIANKSNFREYILNNRTIFLSLANIDDTKIRKIIDALEIKFKSLDCEHVHQALLNHIFENQLYILNEEMIEHVIKNKNANLLANLPKAHYTTILQSDYKPLIQYVDNNLVDYIENVALIIESNVHEKNDIIMNLLSRLIDNTETGIKIIKKEEFLLEDIKNCCFKNLDDKKESVCKFWEELYDNNKVIASWENVFVYYNVFNLDKCLIDFIQNNIEQLKILDINVISEDEIINFAKSFLISNIQDSAYEELIDTINVDISVIKLTELDKDKMKILIEHKYFQLRTEYYASIKQSFSDLHILYLIQWHDEFINNIAYYPIDIDDAERLINKEIFSEKEKLKIIESISGGNISNFISNELCKYKETISKALFEKVWSIANKDLKYQFLLNQLSIFTNKELSEKFNDLGGVYAPLAVTGTKVTLMHTDYNINLVNALLNRNYLSSTNDETETNEETGEVIKKIVCRVKRSLED